MMDLDWCITFSLRISTLLLGAVGVFLFNSVSSLPAPRRRFYTVITLLPMLIVLLELVTMLSELLILPAQFPRWGIVLRELLHVPEIPIEIAFLLYSSGESLRRNRAFYAVSGIQAVQLGLIVLYELLGLPYSLQPEGGLRFEPMAAPGLIAAFALAAVCIAILASRWTRLNWTWRIFFLLCYLLPNSLFILIFLELFLLREQDRLYREQNAELLRQKEELIRQKTQVAVLQMRPHFIHNTLTSIYYLCRQDPPRAQQVILDFSTYLKTNFTAIVSETPIPFPKELEHTRAYLAVEQTRFPDKLRVAFDTPVIDFQLPPLTLQPIVENAIKYGVSVDLDALELSIRTQDSPQGVTITVEDNGPGYAPSDEDAPHFALDNIRERLKTMCGGTLEIQQREAGGGRHGSQVIHTDEKKTMRQFRDEGYEEGHEDGRQETILKAIRNLTETFQITVEKAMEGLKIPVEDRRQYASLLSN